MITQQELDILNKFQPGDFDVTINGKLVDDRYIFYITVNSNKSKDEVLTSKNDLLREFISIDTVYRYILKHCYNTRKVTINVENKNIFKYLQNVVFKIKDASFFNKLR